MASCPHFPYSWEAPLEGFAALFLELVDHVTPTLAISTLTHCLLLITKRKKHGVCTPCDSSDR